jgi:ketosteroid isomerase-like protein
MTREKKLITDVMKALSEGRDQPFLDAMHDEMQWVWMGSGGLSRAFIGKSAVLNELWKSVRADIVQPFKVMPRLIVADHEYVVVECSGDNTATNGKEYHNRYCWVMRIRDNRIIELREYMDTELVRKTF